MSTAETGKQHLGCGVRDGLPPRQTLLLTACSRSWSLAGRKRRTWADSAGSWISPLPSPGVRMRLACAELWKEHLGLLSILDTTPGAGDAPRPTSTPLLHALWLPTHLPASTEHRRCYRWASCSSQAGNQEGSLEGLLPPLPLPVPSGPSSYQVVPWFV